jgi:hypothetical protein
MNGPFAYRRVVENQSLEESLTGALRGLLSPPPKAGRAARRRKGGPGITEVYSAAMGRVITVPAGPQPWSIDLRACPIRPGFRKLLG